MSKTSHMASRSRRPSPIDITTEHMKDVDMPALNNPFANSDFEKELAECTNNGMTGKYIVPHRAGIFAYSKRYFNRASSFTVSHDFQVACYVKGKSGILSGGPLKDDYVFDSIHFHWGKTDSTGSEHQINGQRFASELHAIFYNKKYANAKVASKMADGLTILSWFGIASEQDNRAMDKIFKVLKGLVEFDAKLIGQTREILGFLEELAQPSSKNQNWVTYEGALTMEPYSDSVTWIIFDKPYAISKKQLDILRNLKRADGTPNVEHSEGIVPLSGRSIYRPIGGEFHTDELDLVQHELL